MWWRRNKSDLGCLGEEIAKHYLTTKGYKILAEHWTCRYGEIDLVGFKDKTYIFFEVKTRRSKNFGLPEESVSYWKQKKLWRSIESFLLKYKLTNVNWQVDVLAINVCEEKKFEIRHLKNVEFSIGG